MVKQGRDRLRDMLDAVLAEDNDTLQTMADDAYTSPFHFSRMLTRDVGESPVALRRRVLLERAAWQLQRGSSVTDTAFDAGYESVEGFTRAFGRAYGHPPSGMSPRNGRGATPTAGDGRGHWLPAPNGIHFHSPTVLYISRVGAAAKASVEPAGDVIGLLARHDVDDTALLLDTAKVLSSNDIERIRLRGNRSQAWDGPDESLADVLHHLVFATLPWIASIAGEDAPDVNVRLGVADLIARHDAIAPRWLGFIRETTRRDGWGDTIIDALCDPPESFVLGQIVAHVVTFSAHRRQLARMMLADAGVDVEDPQLDPDPIMWQRRQNGASA